uniref:Uncharacterized protein n=1 Tax=Chlamydomonas leiostraca TaxID=1034604 RepID=A0A7S0S4X6_9CHLO|mmetsp:Transcript_7386/g.18349  ORF Transcript_7386/g.18349 Transcript_7386/m.18349 type:complete len:261 (+) Transcript_7386:50-832(+)|eukprot:CAMPEP_0202868450 /NCGR_PEP_ID=MMETSP1391-20130828/10888_1 /ASSEMBLY_ACC=CAM_ASM_000867 /TAXON_ID=1034604 /ORGANISM="Chlamydomonas leiostraca, Strain SAG 11-49" /LENGTH=260 /DNA_ID=CAMNT_0049548625 /DNA_START=50 /DNA_END=832 /DNA_ORIENTATION=-
MDSDSSDDELPGVAGDLTARLATAKAGVTIEGKLKGVSSEAKNLSGGKLGLGVNTNLESATHELQLKQQAAVFISQRESEIESYHATLNEALAEVRRLRVAEEARLAGRVAAVQDAFAARLADLQAEYQQRAEELERRTLAHLNELRQESEVAVASRVRALSTHISPTKSPISPGLAGTMRTQAQPRAELPAFLTPQAARGGGSTLLTAQYGPPGSTGRIGGGGTARTLFGTLDSSGKGLHRTEPRVLQLLGGDDEEEDA